jgi:hypothetical protein
MTTNTISAAANPALANNLINSALAEAPEQSEVNIVPPSDTSLTLPGGYLTAAGEVITDAEVRELNGSDEEAIARASNIGKAVLTILQRGVIRVGNHKADEKLLDQLLSGDRDMLLLAIFKATFGKTAELSGFCVGCGDVKQVEIDIDEDIKVKSLLDPINDRIFTVQGKKNTFTVQLPTGITQKEMILNSDKSAAELSTIMLENTVMKIDNSPVLSKLQVQNLGLVDRRKINEAINKRLVGPQFDDVKVTCPDCEGEVSVPVNFGTLFQF